MTFMFDSNELAALGLSAKEYVVLKVIENYNGGLPVALSDLEIGGIVGLPAAEVQKTLYKLLAIWGYTFSTELDGKPAMRVDVDKIASTVAAHIPSKSLPKGGGMNVNAPNAAAVWNEVSAYMKQKFGYAGRRSKYWEQQIAKMLLHQPNLTAKDFMMVVYHKTAQWGGDDEMKKYLRPSTLFGNKFKRYHAEALDYIDSLKKQRA